MSGYQVVVDLEVAGTSTRLSLGRRDVPLETARLRKDEPRCYGVDLPSYRPTCWCEQIGVIGAHIGNHERSNIAGSLNQIPLSIRMEEVVLQT